MCKDYLGGGKISGKGADLTCLNGLGRVMGRMPVSSVRLWWKNSALKESLESIQGTARGLGLLVRLRGFYRSLKIFMIILTTFLKLAGRILKPPIYQELLQWENSEILSEQSNN